MSLVRDTNTVFLSWTITFTSQLRATSTSFNYPYAHDLPTSPANPPRLTPTFDKSIYRRYKDFMKTLTITDAKKNLGRWLTAAARGEDIGIICGADIVALRKVNVESTDY